MKRHTQTVIANIFVLFFLIYGSSFCFAKKYYVSVNGNNSNSGSIQSPWKNIAYACKYTQFVVGDSICLGAGTFIESEVCKIPGGIHVVGVDTISTIIKSSQSPVFLLENYQNPSNRQHISNFRLDGQNKSAGIKGMEIRKVYGVFIHDVVVENFVGDENGGGINLSYADNCNIYNSSLRNNAGVLINSCGGNLGVGELNNCNFYNLTIKSDNGYAIKTAITEDNVIKNTKFFNLRIQVGALPCSKWNNLAFELYKINCQNVKIFNCYMNNVLSLSPYSVGNSRTVEVYNNHFQVPNSVNAYAIEASISNLIAHHNYFEGGLYPFGNWVTTSSLISSTIHHNVFDNQNGPTALIHMPFGLSPSKFYNNTVVLRRPIRCFYLPSGGTVDIKNNLFVSAVGAMGDSLGITASSVFTKNLFYNITPRGTQTITTNPLLPLSGTFPAKYIPGAGSPAINNGLVIPGITDDAVGVPDLGAFESGTTPWSVGVTTTPPVLAKAFANKLSGIVPLSINFDGTYSMGNNLTYKWILGNGAVQTGSTTSYTYTTAGNYNVLLVVTDNSNVSDTIPLTIRAFPDSQPNEITLEAESYNTMNGVIKNSTNIGGCDNLDWICFNNVNLSTGYNTFSTRAAVPNANQKIELRLDSPTGQLLDEFTLTQTANYNTYAVNTYNINAGKGIQNLYFVFKGGSGVGNFDWFSFSVPRYYVDSIMLQAENSDDYMGVIKNTTYISGCDNTEWVSFNDVNLSSGYNILSTKAAVVNANQKIQIRQNSPIGNLIDEYTLSQTGSYTTYSINKFGLPHRTGIQNLYFVFNGGYGVGNFDYFTISIPRYQSGSIILEAESYDSMSLPGVVKNSTYIGGCDNLEWVKFSNVDLSAGYSTFSTKAAVVNPNQKIQLRLDSPTGTLLRECNLLQSGSYTNFVINNFDLSSGSGVHDIYIVFIGGYGVGNFDSFIFSSSGSGVKGNTSEIVNVPNENEVKVYPRSGSNREFFVQMEKIASSRLKLIDLQGKAWPFNTKIIDNRKLLMIPEYKIKKGVYLLIIENRNYTKTEKIIIF